MNSDNKARDDGAVKVMAHLFKEMCDADPELTDPSARRRVSAAFFAEWLQENVALKNGTEVCAELGVPDESWAFVVRIAETGNYIPVMNVWPRVILGDAPDPKHPLRNFHLLAVLEWEDGSMLPLSVFTPREFAPRAVLTDGVVASLLNQQVQVAVNAVMDNTLDGLKEHTSETYGGEGVFNVLMGAMMKVIPQLDKAVQPYLYKWMRLVQGMIRPPMPAAVREHVAAVRRQIDAAGKPAGRPQEGWDS